jgi:biopolymer transport protein ExbB
VRGRPSLREGEEQKRGAIAAKVWTLRVALAVGLLGLAGLMHHAFGQAPQPADSGARQAAQEEQKVAPVAEENPIATKNLLEVIQDGGPLMIPILVCSFVLCVFIFERVISLRRGRVIPGPFVKRFLEQLREKQIDRDTALELCEQNKSPVAEVFAAAVKKWDRPSVEVEQAIIDTGERVTNGLRRYLRLLNGIATISPLLGLLGTVLGMIKAFNAIATASAMGRPELLAAGIGQALLTTAAGLSVAIPALIAYLFFVGRVDRLIMDIDALGQQVVGLLASDGWERQAASRSSSSRKKAA